MKLFSGLQFDNFEEQDVELLAPVMKRAFDEDAKRHLNEEHGGPDGYDDGNFLRKWALHKDSRAFKISKDEKPIGVVILWINKNNENFLGNMFIDADLQDKGLGTAVWKFVESEYPETVIWRTETPGFSKRNHNFYVNKCGFKIVRIDNPGNKYEESYFMEKEMVKKRFFTDFFTGL
ncbi:MAG TPA: GNAT family N-acetyltransferase [Candidatus Wallbacteria bacterium]|nr:GNAT family N-acetyltransferase [Candidatus Wallbacteria bacterium]